MNKLLLSACIAVLSISFTACSDDDDNTYTHTTTGTTTTSEDNTTISDTTLEANRFVYETMSDYYYWYTQMPNLDYRKQSDTEEYFDNLLYSGDKFSFITDDAEAYLKAEEGISTEKGWDYTLMLYSSKDDQVVGVVNYVYANTPAAKAGAKRGDIIVTVDGSKMTTSSYSSFYNSTTTYGVKRFNTETNSYDDLEYSITAAEISTSPVAEHSIFETEKGKVGYLLYMDYYAEFNNELTSVFSEFKSEGVTNLILDLRYNTGGAMTAMQHLCSLIAPQSNVANKDLLIWYEFNDKLQQSYNKESSATYFNDTLATNSLGLDKVIILVGSSTYSASEATIIGLQPYMDVYTIGYTTGGKNTSMFVMSPSDFTYSKTGKPYYSSYINNWLIAPIVAVYKNSASYTFDTTDGDGMEPDYSFNEYGVDYMGILGNADEPLTALAIEYIENGTISSDNNKAAMVEPNIIAHSDRIGGAIINKPQDF